MVISDNEGARALERAVAADVETAVVRWADYSSRSDFSAAVADAVSASGAKGVVLAGFMRILSRSFIDRFPDRVLNIHPSLLPAFPGAHAVQAALDRGVSVTGVTIHIVDEEVDHGPIIAQRAVEVRSDDDVESLHTRIQEVEHVLYPEIVRAFITDEISVEGGKVMGWR